MTNASSDQFALQNKQININQLKSQIETFEKERAAKFADLANNNTLLSELKDKFKEMIKKTNELTNTFENKRMDAQEYKDCHKPTKDETFGVPDVEWPLDNAEKTLTVTKVKYRCLYGFPARNNDELTIEPGDIVIVCITQFKSIFILTYLLLIERLTPAPVQSRVGSLVRSKDMSVGFLRLTSN